MKPVHLNFLKRYGDLSLLSLRILTGAFSSTALRTTSVLRHVSLAPPKVNGKYKLTFESVPSISRWRYERGGWKMFYFTTHKGTALDAMKKDGVE